MTRTPRAFTLIEILTALMIFSLVIVAVIEAITLQLRAQQIAEDTTRAVILAENILEQFRYELDLLEADESGEFEGSHAGMSWNYKVTETESAGLYHVKVTITWEDGAAERTHVVETLMAER